MTRIVIIDDTPLVRDLLKEVLEANGFEVAAAETADEGRNLVDTFEPDLVLLDLDLPDVSGVELCKMWRRGEKHRTLPVIMVTGNKNDQVRGFQAGADDYVTKPFGSEILLERVRAVLKRAGQAPPAAPASTPASAPQGTWDQRERRRPVYRAAVEFLLQPEAPSLGRYPSLAPSFLLVLCALIALASQGSLGASFQPVIAMLAGLLAWAALAGVLAGACALTGAPLRPAQAVQILSLAGLPLLLKLAGAGLVGLMTGVNPLAFSAGPAVFFRHQPFWLARLDLFEAWAAVLLYLLLRPREPADSHAAAIGAVSVWLSAVLMLAGVTSVQGPQ